VLAGRDIASDDQWAGVPLRRLTGLDAVSAHRMLDGVVAERLVDQLVRMTDGNPLALTEVARSMSPEQRRGSARCPTRCP